MKTTTKHVTAPTIENVIRWVREQYAHAEKTYRASCSPAPGSPDRRQYWCGRTDALGSLLANCLHVGIKAED